MPRIQRKIMGALAALVVAVVFITGLLAERELRARLTRDIERSLREQAALVVQLVEHEPFEATRTPELDAIAREAAQATGARVTLVGPGGRVLADSDVQVSELPGVENHARRSEIAAALRGELGRSTRRSDTVKRSLMYVALPVRARPGEPPSGVVRLAVDLERIDAAATELRGELLTAGAFGLIAALALSYGLSLLSLRPIRELREVVGDMAEGQLKRQLHWPAHDERGEIARSINAMARQLREQLAGATREKEQLEAVLASMVEGVLVLDTDGRVLMANPRLRELLSLWGGIAGRPAPELVRSPAIDGALREAAAAKQTVVREIELHAPDRVLLMHATGFPSEGPRAGTVAVFHDVSELRRVDRIRRDFIANASHELRTPLTAIRGFADTLVSTEQIEPEQMKSYLDVIMRNAERMANLLNDLLALSRLESGRTELELGDVELARVAETLLADFAPRLQQASLEAHLHAVPCPPCRADRGAIEQVLSNLLSNAARYSNPGGRIDVRIEPDEGRVRLTVEDSGIGIPEADRERIFERFYRVDASRSRALGSTGLGLSIVKHLVSAMGGEIRVESELGRGSRFVITLPAGTRA